MQVSTFLNSPLLHTQYTTDNLYKVQLLIVRSIYNLVVKQNGNLIEIKQFRQLKMKNMLTHYSRPPRGTR